MHQVTFERKAASCGLTLYNTSNIESRKVCIQYYYKKSFRKVGVKVNVKSICKCKMLSQGMANINKMSEESKIPFDSA